MLSLPALRVQIIIIIITDPPGGPPDLVPRVFGDRDVALGVRHGNHGCSFDPGGLYTENAFFQRAIARPKKNKKHYRLLHQFTLATSCSILEFLRDFILIH